MNSTFSSSLQTVLFHIIYIQFKKYSFSQRAYDLSMKQGTNYSDRQLDGVAH